MATLSEWQPVSIKPTLIGLYKRKEIDGDIGWQHWNGKYWCWWYSSKKEYVNYPNITTKSIFQEGEWQGVIED